MDMTTEERLARLEEAIVWLKKEIDDLKREISVQNKLLKTIIYIYVISLAFVAAALGFHFHVPAP